MTGEDEFHDRLESRLMSHGVYISGFEDEDGRYRIEYESLYADQGIVPHREIGRVINVLLDLHGDDWEGVDLDAVVTDLDGHPEAEWHVKREWLSDLIDGNLSELDFSEKVIDTLQE